MKHSLVSCSHKLRKRRKNYILIQEYLHNYLPRRTDYQRMYIPWRHQIIWQKKVPCPGNPYTLSVIFIEQNKRSPEGFNISLWAMSNHFFYYICHLCELDCLQIWYWLGSSMSWNIFFKRNFKPNYHYKVSNHFRLALTCKSGELWARFENW